MNKSSCIIAAVEVSLEPAGAQLGENVPPSLLSIDHLLLSHPFWDLDIVDVACLIVAVFLCIDAHPIDVAALGSRFELSDLELFV